MDTRQPFDYSPAHVALGVEFNQNDTVFTVGADDGFRLYEIATGKLIYSKGTTLSFLPKIIADFCRS